MKERRFLVAALYRFVPLPYYREVRLQVLELGRRYSVCGSVLLASEGINGTVAGSPEELRGFLESLQEMPEFRELSIKFSTTDIVPFQRWKVRLKKEIVSLKKPEADPNLYPGRYVDADEWDRLVSDPEVMVVDVRNSFEIEYGSFERSIDPKTEDFSEFPAFIERQNWQRSQPLAIFCTGGIRCEKAGAYLAAKGFSNVKQLDGGILKYLETRAGQESSWRGTCFVFDERVALDTTLTAIAEANVDPLTPP